jgi:hypothetical protein
VISLADNAAELPGFIVFPSDWKADMLQAWKDGELEMSDTFGGWREWPARWSPPSFDDKPSRYRRRPQPALWYPPQQEGFGPWIECTLTTKFKAGQHVAFLYARERERRRYIHGGFEMPCSLSSPCEGWLAYCVKLEEGIPTPAEIEQLTQVDEQDADRDQRLADEAARADMEQRDLEGLTGGIWHRFNARAASKEDKQGDAPSETPEGLMHEHRADRFGRFGRWGA